MKQLLLLAAVVSMAATGCVGTKQFVRNSNNCGPSCHVARSQSAPRPDVVRTACYDGSGPTGYEMNLTGGLLYGLKPCSCNSGCDDSCCGDCCECECGCPEDCCCESECGCPEDCCCESDCCCGDQCCGAGCDCGCQGGGCSAGACGSGGCNCYGNCGNCGCRGGLCQRMAGRVAAGGCCPHSGGYPASYNFTPGPQSGQTAYPYYTTRGPRDFLMCNPQPLGPY